MIRNPKETVRLNQHQFTAIRVSIGLFPLYRKNKNDKNGSQLFSLMKIWNISDVAVDIAIATIIRL